MKIEQVFKNSSQKFEKFEIGIEIKFTFTRRNKPVYIADKYYQGFSTCTFSVSDIFRKQTNHKAHS